MTIQRTVTCEGKQDGRTKEGRHLTVRLNIPGEPSDDPLKPPYPKLYVCFSDLTEEEYKFFEPGHSYTLTIS